MSTANVVRIYHFQPNATERDTSERSQDWVGKQQSDRPPVPYHVADHSFGNETPNLFGHLR